MNLITGVEILVVCRDEWVLVKMFDHKPENMIAILWWTEYKSLLDAGVDCGNGIWVEVKFYK